MNEQFLSYLWKYRCLEKNLRTESGHRLEVIHPGEQNHDSGPDFFNAKIRIGNTTWAGNVEIHVRASDWHRHGHDTDPAYDRVILHVVYEADRIIFHNNGEPVETLVTGDKFPGEIFERYRSMMANPQWIPCESQFEAGSDYGFSMWAPALALERLQYKTEALRQLLARCGFDWDEVFYHHLASCFGFKVNQFAFEMLAKSIPIRVARQHGGHLFQLEALLYGQSGMLGHHLADPYPVALLEEYRFLGGKYRLEPISSTLWKFLRLRPSNFPTIRISQFASLMHLSAVKCFNIIDGCTLPEIKAQLKLTASSYWDNHFIFDKATGQTPKVMGEACVNLLVINGIVPFLFLFGGEKKQPGLCERALGFLEKTAGEYNTTILRWKENGFTVENALQTQALLQLKKNYCDRKRCLECRIGSRLLGASSGITPEFRPERRQG